MRYTPRRSPPEIIDFEEDRPYWREVRRRPALRRHIASVQALPRPIQAIVWLAWALFLLLCTFSGWLVVGGIARAEPLDWAKQGGQIGPLSQLAAGFSGGMVCNRTTNILVAEQFTEKVMNGKAMTPSQAADFGFLVIGVHAMQVSMLSVQEPKKAAIKKHCSVIDEAFGPNGTAIKGLLSE
ncbi:hypothetical protein [Xanthobacter versatilis]|uniref:hypothetical protein n=1 Tax=Xanthobacter autotrophicus (strain ATCC BAA-1158 / Py2) TaxID=78245 RepID=UPI00372A2132